VIVNDLDHFVLHKIPHDDIAIAPCAGEIVAVNAHAQNATFMNAFNCAEDGSCSKVPFFDSAILGPREQYLIVGARVCVELKAIYCVGVGTRGSPGLQGGETIRAREEAMLQTSAGEMKKLVIWTLMLKGLR